MRIFKFYVLPTLGFILLLAGGLWLARFKILKLHYRNIAEKGSIEPVIELHEKKFLEDRQILSQYDLFRPSKGLSDAGTFLNPKIHWEIGEIHHQGELVLPHFVHKELMEDWLNKKPLFKKMGLSFKWMKDLEKYDVWSPEKDSPAFPEGKKYLVSTFPFPTYKDLMIWAKLRYLYGKENNDSVSALKEVRHLIRLIWTNDSLVSSMVVINMLKVEQEFYDILESKDRGTWTPIPQDVLMRGKRHFYSLGNVADIYLSDEMFHKMTHTDLGICLIVSEGLMAYLDDRNLLIEDLPGKFARMDKLVKETQETKCRQSLTVKMWEDPTWPSVMDENPDVFAAISDSYLSTQHMSGKELKNHPDLKASLGYIMATIARPNYFSSYNNP